MIDEALNGRKPHVTHDGYFLERKNLYLPSIVWRQLYALSREAGVSASFFIEDLILEKLKQ